MALLQQYHRLGDADGKLGEYRFAVCHQQRSRAELFDIAAEVIFEVEHVVGFRPYNLTD